MNQSIFKAYDVRGKYPKELNEEAAFEIAAAVSRYWLKGKRDIGQVRIVVGRDGRLSSPTLYRAVLDGLQSINRQAQIVKVGTMTTPTLYFLVNKLKADGGIMVTASHNPKEYNGLKIVGPKAEMISGKEIEKLVISN